MIRIWFSNHTEWLSERLVDALGGPRASLFEAETVIVPSAAVQRALCLQMAERHGVCAQVEFGFLAQWLWRQIARVVPQVGAQTPFAPAVLAWRIDHLLGDPALCAGHPRLAAYLAAADPVMRFDLAQRLAGLYDHYTTYRSDWLAAWAEGASALPRGAAASADGLADEAWQAALWRRLLGELGIAGSHPAQHYLAALAADGAALAPRGPVHLFGLPAIPPLYLQVLRGLGRHADLRLYLLNPCREYWFDLVDRKRLHHLAARGQAAHAEVGNPLLSGWASQTQAQIDLLLDGDDIDDHAHFVEAPGSALLAQLQNAVLDGQPLAPHSLVIAPGDRSLELHVCHSLTRELEVLQDRLLGLFAQGSELTGGALQPDEVLVVLPDLATAAQLIDAVFGTAPPERWIPFTVTGRPRRSVNRCARALRELLALLNADGPASGLFELLQQPPVARRFGLDGAALARVHDWFHQAGVRHGLAPLPAHAPVTPDGALAAHRHGLAAGLERLFLAHALPQQVDEPLAGVLPAGQVDGSEALILGALWRLAQRLHTWQVAHAQAHTPAEWLALLLSTVDGLLQPEGDELDEARELQASLRTLVAQMDEGGVSGTVEPAVLQRALDGLLDEPARGGVPTGRVSFAAMSSLRGLPFRVIACLGLDDGAYPSTGRALEFDLMAQHPRRGDRQRRHDERNTFLDLLLAARQTVHLSHTGRSVRDNSPLPPSVLVAELLDLLRPALHTPPGEPPTIGRLIVEHPLQAFSPRAFSLVGDPRLRSHQRELAEALLASTAPHPPAAEAAAVDVGIDTRNDTGNDTESDPGTDPNGADERPRRPTGQRFFDHPLPAPDAAWRTLDIERLARFFDHPARALLQQRLGLSLAHLTPELEDDEAFTPGWEARAALVAQVLPAALAGADPARLDALAAAGIHLPDGALGRAWRREALAGLRRQAQALQAALAEPVLAPQRAAWTLTVDGEAWQLSADFPALRPSGLVLPHAGNARVREFTRGWLWHLALCAAAPAGCAPQTLLVAADGLHRWRRCDDALAQLGTWLRGYREGLCTPLPFYPRSAWAYRTQGSLSAARSAWNGHPGQPRGESDDPAHRLALRGVADPLDAAFTACASALLDPLRAHLDSQPLAALSGTA